MRQDGQASAARSRTVPPVNCPQRCRQDAVRFPDAIVFGFDTSAPATMRNISLSRW
jgi:hypothetical protein